MSQKLVKGPFAIEQHIKDGYLVEHISTHNDELVAIMTGPKPVGDFYTMAEIVDMLGHYSSYKNVGGKDTALIWFALNGKKK